MQKQAMGSIWTIVCSVRANPFILQMKSQVQEG